MRDLCLTALLAISLASPVLAASDIFLPSGVTIAPGQQAAFPVTLAQPAPSGGIFVSLSSSDPSKVTISPANILILQGLTTVTRPPQLTGIDFGSAAISATAYNMTGDTQTVTVIGSGAIILPAAFTLAPNQSAAFPVTLSTPAPASGATVALTTSDNTKVTLSTTSVFIGAGSTTPNVQPQITGLTTGVATISASASGYTPASRAIQVQAAQVSMTLNFSPTSLTMAGVGTSNLQLNLSSPAPAGGLTVNLVSNNTGAVTAPPSVTFGANRMPPLPGPRTIE